MNPTGDLRRELGLLATPSPVNAGVMASSRVNLAMARDRLVPPGRGSRSSPTSPGE